VALGENGEFISGMGLAFRDFDNDGYPGIVFRALPNQTFAAVPEHGERLFRRRFDQQWSGGAQPQDGRIRSRPLRLRQ
jgi:hypothetical protein